MEVAGGGRRTAELDAALTAVAQLAAGGVDDADLVAGQGLAAGDETKSVRLAGLRRVGPPDRTNVSRTMRSISGPRPSGGKASPTEDSASPYTGVIASRRNP